MPGIDHDVLHRFLLERSGLHGAWVRLDNTWSAIRSRVAYPLELARLFGETVAAAALFTAHIKMNGRLSIQLKGSGPLRSVFAECTHTGTMRGLAHWHDPLPTPLTPRTIGKDALLAITIESQPSASNEPVRYQGLIGLDCDRLCLAFEHYFAQSEQLPTRLLLSATQDCATGLMVQQLPGADADTDAWARAQAQFDTLAKAELRDTPPETLLYRLFHQENVRLLGHRPLRFGCSCSRERVGRMLLGVGHEEAYAALQDDVAEVICEFCNQRYRFDRVDLEQLFAGGGSAPVSPLAQ